MSKIGVCKVWDDDKAYGFLKTEDGSETFIHMTACDGGKLAVGSEVRFDEDRGPDGRTKAKNVSLISGEIKKEAQRKGWMQRAHDGATAQRGGKDWLGRGGEQERKRTQAEIEMAEAEEEAIRRLSAGEKAADLIPQGPVAGPACGPMGPPGMAGCGPAVVAPPGMEHLEPEPVVERQPEDMNPEEIYEKLLQLYQHHRPHQLKNVGPMLIKYQGREAEILRTRRRCSRTSRATRRSGYAWTTPRRIPRGCAWCGG